MRKLQCFIINVTKILNLVQHKRVVLSKTVGSSLV